MLSPRNRSRLQRWGQRMMNRQKTCKFCPGDCMPLADLSSGSSATVMCNHDTKTIERGLYMGAKLDIYRNEAGEPNLIVAVNDSRYVLDRRIAGTIMVKMV